MSYSKEAYDYLNSDHIRLLTDDNKVPSIEDRVMSAFDAGAKSHHRKNWLNAFKQLDSVAGDKCKINFPKTND